MDPAPVRLTRSRARTAENDALAAAAGGRVGLDGVLRALNRVGSPAYAGRSAAEWTFAWDAEDSASTRWWPQGVTSSADAGAATGTDLQAGRPLLVTTAYAKVVRGVGKGARVSVVDLGDPQRPRYRHVLLVVADLDEHGALGLRPVNAHAGGIVWHGPWLFVAGTGAGIYAFHLDDVVAVTGTDRPSALGPLEGGGVGGFGHRFVLPVRHVHRAQTEEGHERVRYSFLSLGRDGSGGRHLVAGEYGRGAMTTRLLRYDLDPATCLPVADDARVSVPRWLHDGGVPRMQGAVEVEGRFYVTTSNGRTGHGSLWVGTPGRLREHPKALPPGPEDICWWPATDRLWTVTEYPGSRFVAALDRSRFD